MESVIVMWSGPEPWISCIQMAGWSVCVCVKNFLRRCQICLTSSQHFSLFAYRVYVLIFDDFMHSKWPGVIFCEYVSVCVSSRAVSPESFQTLRSTPLSLFSKRENVASPTLFSLKSDCIHFWSDSVLLTGLFLTQRGHTEISVNLACFVSLSPLAYRTQRCSHTHTSMTF